MINHLVGKHPCPYASSSARATAKRVRGDEDAGTEGDDESEKPRKKRKQAQSPEKVQTRLKAFKGVDMPFSKDQAMAIHNQFLRATISANLAYRWVEDPEVCKLFEMFRSLAKDVIPSRRVLGGRLLDDANNEVVEDLGSKMKGQYVTLSYVRFDL